MESSELFKKHFGNKVHVDLKHPNIEALFEELNNICLKEDKIKINKNDKNSSKW
jgi:hypothetical protein